jgi:hypothetical protein
MLLKNRSNLRKSTALLFALVASVAGLSAAVASRGPTTHKASQTAADSEYKPLRALLRDRDLDVSGERTCMEAPPESFAALASESLAVVVGRIADVRSEFDGDDGVVSFYRVAVDRVVKNPPPSITVARGRGEIDPIADTLTFTRLSGTVSENGHTLKVRLPGDERVTEGKKVILFLRWDPKRAIYFPVADAAGIFLVDDAERVEPVLTRLASKYAESSTLDDFVRRIVEPR